MIGVGLNGGIEIVCGLYDLESGDLVVNIIGKYRLWFEMIWVMGYLLLIYIDIFWLF